MLNFGYNAAPALNVECENCAILDANQGHSNNQQPELVDHLLSMVAVILGSLVAFVDWIAGW